MARVAHLQGGLWSSVDPHDIEGVEALLEAYFMQVDFSMSRLVILKVQTNVLPAASIPLDQPLRASGGQPLVDVSG